MHVLAKKQYFVYFVFLYVNIKRVYVNQNSTAFIHYLYNYDLNTLMLGVLGVLIKWTVVTTTARVLNTDFFKQGMETVPLGAYLNMKERSVTKKI